MPEANHAVSNVGIFWLIQTETSVDPTWLIHLCPTDSVEPYGDCYTCSHGHHDLWETWRGKCPRPSHAAVIGLDSLMLNALRASEYDDWPRGRVVREPNRTVVYADRQLLTPARQAVMLETFSLDAETTAFRRDAHYDRARRVGVV